MKLFLIKLERFVCHLVWASGQSLHLLESQHMSVIRLGLLDVPENNLLTYFSPPALYIVGEILEREQGTEL